MNLQGTKALVVGLGRSGIAAAEFLARAGARVTATDLRLESELGEAAQRLPSSVHLELGGHRVESFRKSSLVILSPGVPALPEVEAAREVGAEVIGEYELACRHLSATLVAITGTNGKSTTTALVGHLLSATGRPVFVGGNLGNPIINAVGSPADRPAGIVVAEASSFQLESVVRAHANVAVLLNLGEDHLDRHGTPEAYRAAKQKIFCNQTREDVAILRHDLSTESPARTLRFSGGAEGDARLDGETIVVGAERYPTRDIPLTGLHNYENAMAAILVASHFGMRPDGIAGGLGTFRSLPHRMQWVGEIDGIPFFDDSKATNVAAVVGSLTGFPKKAILIAGGRDKGGNLEPLVEIARKQVRFAVLIGEARQRFCGALGAVIPTEIAVTLQDAVRKAFENAQGGDAVILSPACASFDMFRNFEERGLAFSSAVAQLRKEIR